MSAERCRADRAFFEGRGDERGHAPAPGRGGRRRHRGTSLPGHRRGARAAGAAPGHVGQLCGHGPRYRGARGPARGFRARRDSQRGLEGQVARHTPARCGAAAAVGTGRVAPGVAQETGFGDWRRGVQLGARRRHGSAAWDSHAAAGAKRCPGPHKSAARAAGARRCGDL